MGFLRSCVVGVSIAYFKMFHKVEVMGLENIPKEGAYILCSNHIHWKDPLLCVSSVKRMVYAIGKEELFSSKFKNWIMRILGVIPVKRDGSGSNGVSILEAINKLKAGYLLLIYPEGTRFGLRRGIKPKKGVALMAMEARVPIIPMAMVGSFKPFTKIKMIVDKPMDITEFLPEEGKKIELRNMVKLTNKVMDRIVELRDSINTEEIERQMNEAEDKREKKIEAKIEKQKMLAENSEKVGEKE